LGYYLDCGDNGGVSVVDDGGQTDVVVLGKKESPYVDAPFAQFFQLDRRKTGSLIKKRKQHFPHM
jgi:hypothetical protein